jgi:hypothetical protein
LEKVSKEIGKSFAGAIGLVDDNARCFQAGNGKGHRHAMVIVSFNNSRVERAGINF